MNKKIIPLIILIPILIGISFILLNNDSEQIQSEQIQSEQIQSEQIQSEQVMPEMRLKNLVQLNTTSLFKVFVYEDDFEIKDDGTKFWSSFKLEKDPKNNDIYEKISSSGNTAVIYPLFTAAAYSEPGFYTYYRGECGEECLTIKMKDSYDVNFSSSGIAANVFWLLGYDVITDANVHQNPEILLNYEKIILLHNEYVTTEEFIAITSHPKVIYLYPNALYAQVTFDYDLWEISLIRGHNYPDPEIRNGFDWEFDNSPDEYDVDCLDMEFSRIDNGWMLNCYPENHIHKNEYLLQQILDF